MSLPKLNVPVYEAILPSTEKVIKYRPFLVKEEKILLTALEDTSGKSLPPAIKQIINNCVQTKLDVEKLPTFDIEYLFLRLRAKSVGEVVSLGLKCECEEVTQVDLNLEHVKVHKNKKHSTKIMLDDSIGVKMKYPGINSLDSSGGTESENGMKILKESIDMIFTEEETHERDSFTENELDEFFDSLNSKQFQKLKEFFDDMPVMKHDIKFKCEKCEKENVVTLQGLNSFFG
jgi:hypothetical protein